MVKLGSPQTISIYTYEWGIVCFIFNTKFGFPYDNPNSESGKYSETTDSILQTNKKTKICKHDFCTW